MKINADIAQDIIEHHFGKKPKELSEMNGGSANYVFLAEVDGEKYIVRVSDEQIKLQVFMKEQWASAKAAENKVPIAEILEVANEASKYPYTIIRYLDGIPAESRPSSERLEIVREMGKYAAIINGIQTSGYGQIFDWSSNQLSRRETFSDFLEKELDYKSSIEIFEKYNILDDDSLAALKKAFREISDITTKPVLCHGDMRLKNILVNEKGKICGIVDWETCTSNIPQWEISIALHDLTIDERDAFLDGYGMSQLEYRNRAYVIKALNVINYAPFVLMAYEEKDEKRKVMIEGIKTRLRGYFDLYSL